MPKEKTKEKNIVGLIKDNELIPNVSLGVFHFETDIREYLQMFPYTYEENPTKNDEYGFDSYRFFSLGLTVWTDNKGIIKSIVTDESCFWNNSNIIGMHIKKFKSIYEINPDSEDVCYMMQERMKTQHVYDFYTIGLQLWTWYGIIRTVIATNYPED